MDSSILQQLPNGGYVVAIIAVVVLFLKKQERHEDKVESIVNRFTDELASSRKEYLEHLRELTNPRRKSGERGRGN